MRVHDPKPLPNLPVPKKLHKPSIDIPKVYGPSGDASMPNVLGGQIIRTHPHHHISPHITTHHHISPHITTHHPIDRWRQSHHIIIVSSFCAYSDKPNEFTKIKCKKILLEI
jgi:hypothetical protein